MPEEKLKKAIGLLFALLFFLVPLFLTPYNSELFEFNKIILVYGFTVLIVGAWIGRMLLQGRILFKRTPLDIPLLLFLTSQFASTLLSIDPHASLWGYYSRFNGGLLSIISYLLLYWAFVSNCEAKEVHKIIKVSLISALIISIYGIFEHFGHSFSCLMFEGHFNVGCWVQDVQTRVFATLGQPNWLAAYLAILIPVAIAQIIKIGSTPRLTGSTHGSTPTRAQHAAPLQYYLICGIFFLCLIFTGSKSGYLGLWLGLAILFLTQLKSNFKLLLLLTTGYLLLTILFGSPIPQINKLIYYKDLTFFARRSPDVPRDVGGSPQGPALEVGGTESGKIRSIVWKGAVEVFKHFPIFGSGVETFAYSYYRFRPVEHNLVSEWDFLYNKAHNEYLNYLATTGALGTLAYLGVIICFIVFCLRIISNHSESSRIIILALFCGWISILVSNFFGFSVVVVSLYFYLIPAFCFVLSRPPTSQFSSPPPTLARKAALVLLLIANCYLLITVLNLWRADYHYANGQKFVRQSQFVAAYEELDQAIKISPNEPVFLSELSMAAVNLALLASEKEATTAAQLAELSQLYSAKSHLISPNNVNLEKTRIRFFYALSVFDPKFLDKAIETTKQVIALSPTDPKLCYNLGLLYGRKAEIQPALENIKKAIELKPNYEEARNALAVFYEDMGQKDKAIEQLEIILKGKPDDKSIQERIEKLKSK